MDFSEEIKGHQCPACGSELAESWESATRQYVYPIVRCEKQHCRLQGTLFTLNIRRDGKPGHLAKFPFASARHLDRVNGDRQ